ncbi:hypothetical protein FSY75_28415 [Streptomyces sp. TR1341]|uniref:hypothetical protein n=1 Tax=Streptomyces sp. TR1341 TaxID=2601266 RepID=UPI00138B0D30|nr:hypothetical protein [Streptomyces sp. TR1341]
MNDTEDRFLTTPSGLRLCYRVAGPEDGVPLLLIAGLGARHVGITGMGHHLAPGVLDRLVGLATDLARGHGAAVTRTRTGEAA